MRERERIVRDKREERERERERIVRDKREEREREERERNCLNDVVVYHAISYTLINVPASVYVNNNLY